MCAPENTIILGALSKLSYRHEILSLLALEALVSRQTASAV
jgi:hypothetical protein